MVITNDSQRCLLKMQVGHSFLCRVSSIGPPPDESQTKVRVWAAHSAAPLGPVGTILKAGSIKGFARHLSLVKESIVATREGLEVCSARGVDSKKFAPVNRNYLPLFLTVPAACLQYRMKVIQDFLEAAIGQETSEIVSQYDDMLQEADRLGVKTPTLKALRPYVVQHATRARQDLSYKIIVHQ